MKPGNPAAVRYRDARWWGAAAVACAGWLLVSGVPTGIVETPLYARMTPVLWWNYPLWVANSVLAGVLTAAYLRGGFGAIGGRTGGGLVGGGLLSVFAVGCPVCNKLVVLVLGFGGAMSYFAPLQPVLGLASTGLLLYGLRVRLGAGSCCPIRPDRDDGSGQEEGSGASTG